MKTEQYNIQTLCDRVGISRRAIRFYVQRGLIPAPVGKGRGTYYTEEHLSRLEEISRLQQLGLSLDAIESVLSGAESEQEALANMPQVSRGQRSHRPVVAEQWLRLAVEDGIELHLNVLKHKPSGEQLLALQAAIQDIFTGESEGE